MSEAEAPAATEAPPAEVKEAVETNKMVVDLAAKNVQALPAKSYLDQTVVPLLHEGLALLSQERPPNPVEWLGLFLLKHKDQPAAQLTPPPVTA
eukprot:m.131347 g.131347  ORF g.131347 m.131347 type:complete len:94 (+) comp16459_c0_seq1:630-911(+)